MGGFFLGLVKGLFATIDKIVVWFVETLYDLLFQISNVQIFTNNDISAFASRLTVILTIFMLFKLSFSFLNYIINPDNMTDKSKGFAKIIQNVAVSLVLLVSYQFVFDKAMDLQKKIIDNETIPKLILGNSASAGKGIKNSGTLSFALFSAFVTPNSTISGCDNYAFLEKPSDACDLSEYTTDVTDYNTPYGNPIPADYEDAVNKQFDAIVNHKDTHALFGHMVAWKKGELYAFDYRFIVSTACGVFAGLILLSFCFDIAVRTIKLGFYRLIAPIPIISYIDPNKGEGIFKKWLSNVGKTYADLFIRLIAIYFAIYIVQLVAGGFGEGLKDLNDQPINNPLVIVFIIIGALMFAKQFPKLIQDITGMSFDSKLELNPFKKVRENALGGKALLGGATALGAAGLAGATNLVHRTGAGIKQGWKKFKESGKKSDIAKGVGKGLGKGLVSGTAGFFSAGTRAFGHSMKGDGFIKSLWAGDQEAMFAKLQREDLERQGSTLGGRIAADAARRVGVLNKGQREIILAGEQDNEIKQKEQKISSIKQEKVRYKERKIEPLELVSKYATQIESYIDGDGAVKGAKSFYDSVVNTNGENLAIVQNAKNSRNKAQVRLEKLEHALAKARTEGKDTRSLEVLVNTERTTVEKLDSEVENARKKGLTDAFNDYRKVRIDRANALSEDDPNVTNLFKKYESAVNEAVSNSDIDHAQKETIKGSYSKGFEGIADTNKKIKNYISTFELVDDEMNKYNSEIETEERAIEDIKNSKDYIRAHDSKSAAKADNAARAIKGEQQEGWTPNPKKMDTRNYMENSVGGSGPLGGTFLDND